MNRRSTLASAMAILAIAACNGSEPVAPSPDLQRGLSYSASAGDGSGSYLVRFTGNAVPANFAANVAALGGEVVFAHAGAGIGAVSGLNDATAATLAASSGISSVDADAVTIIDDPAAVEVESIDMPESPSNPTTAAFYPRQWNMRAIGANTAWAAGKLGSSSVKVGIIDTGIDYLHPDTYGRVDLTLSKSFLSAVENARVQTAFPGAHEVADLHYHGTHVATTAVSNSRIASGVSSMTTLVGLKVCTPGTSPAFQASCPTSGVLGAILYAADNGINIVNMSLGGTFNRRDGSARGGFGPSFIATINQVMSYASGRGVTIVVSAGNSALDMDHDANSFKAYCSAVAVICVSATAPTTGLPLVGGAYSNLQNIDNPTLYTNFGRSAVSVAAPGGNALGGINAVPVWSSCSGFTIVTPLLACRSRFWNPTTGTGSGSVVGISGTSMASPHAAGVAALIAANGITSPSQIASQLKLTADDLGQAGNDPYYGHGRINAARAAGAL